MKYIGLLDCNNFFVSCERLFRPDLLRKPVAVLSSNDGCIVARSNEVKAMGVPMGLPLFQAKQLVDMNQVTLFSSNFTLYRDISARVMQVLQEEVGKCEVYSIDEAFFEIDTADEAELGRLRSRIIQKTGIPVSIGVAHTKTLAKEASEIGKKGSGVCLLTPELWRTKASDTPCGDIWGLGRASVKQLTEVGVRSAGDFMNLERSFIRSVFGVAGERVFNELHGTAVYGFGESSEDSRQSITSSRSFAKTTSNLTELQSAVAYHVAQVATKIRAQQLCATIMHVELRASRHSDFVHRGGSVGVVFDVPTNSTQSLTKEALTAVAKAFDCEVPYKKTGVTLAGLVPDNFTSLSLFDELKTPADNRLNEVLDSLQKKFGFDALHSAAILSSRDRSSKSQRSKLYTTAWKDIPTVQA